MRAFNDKLKHLMLEDPPSGSDTQGAEATGMNVVGCPRLFATIYHPGRKPTDLEWWLELLSESTRHCRYVTRSFGVLRATPKGEAIGVLWEKARGKQLADAKPKRAWSAISYAKKVLLGLRDLREYGLIHADVHEKNLFRDRWNNPKLIDNLSFSTIGPVGWADGRIAKRESPTVNPDYLAPELLVSGSSAVHTPKTLDHTAYTIAYVILKHDLPFETLNNFGVKLTDAELKMYGQYGRFTEPAKQFPDRFIAPDNGIPWHEVHEEVRWLFNQAFIRGRIVPDARPTLDELIGALRRWQLSKLIKIGAVVGALSLPIVFTSGVWMGKWQDVPAPGAVEKPVPVMTSPAPTAPQPAPPTIPVKQEEPKTQDPEPDDGRPPLWRKKK